MDENAPEERHVKESSRQIALDLTKKDQVTIATDDLRMLMRLFSDANLRIELAEIMKTSSHQLEIPDHLVEIAFEVRIQRVMKRTQFMWPETWLDSDWWKEVSKEEPVMRDGWGSWPAIYKPQSTRDSSPMIRLEFIMDNPISEYEPDQLRTIVFVTRAAHASLEKLRFSIGVPYRAPAMSIEEYERSNIQFEQIPQMPRTYLGGRAYLALLKNRPLWPVEAKSTMELGDGIVEMLPSLKPAVHIHVRAGRILNYSREIAREIPT
ncbi:hypothetical protein QAD02_018047 [Eretmocerus hayati]|uniref:Uncharacterized protein n=1 Tax=Eretmocerus hayati TaxID=131215 RepID=A0ACC2PF94_9HYME|nr:hypothetical protein QAD02_018047 [Eretmocerus hayati]